MDYESHGPQNSRISSPLDPIIRLNSSGSARLGAMTEHDISRIGSTELHHIRGLDYLLDNLGTLRHLGTLGIKVYISTVYSKAGTGY